MAQAIPQSAMIELPKVEPVEIIDYSEDEIKYLSNLQKRLEHAKNMREQPHPEFDDMTYTQYWQKNEDLANIKIKPKINKQDIQFQTGTLRTKLFAFLSSLLSLNLSADISAYDKNDVKISALGNAMEDIIEKTDELDNDEEKKMLRQYEMQKQGDVFVEEIWDDKWIIEKQPVKDYTGKFRGVKISKKEVKKIGRPVRNIISGLQVYLGDLTKYEISDQPFIFTVQTMRYDEAEQIYGKFENWQYISKSLKTWSGDSDKAMSQNAWRLLDTGEGLAEIIKYQDKENNEYQIIINGIPLLPLGFPFPWGWQGYNITQQHGRPIRHNFAYGKSFTFENKNPVQLLDEMMRLALLKTQKSFLPPYLNLSGRVISSNVLMPGRITMGLQANSLVPINDKETQGVTNAEFNMIQELLRTIDSQTTSQTFAGSMEAGETTATQIRELQRQARLMLGITILSASLLEKKLIDMRLMNVLKNWFNPLDKEVDEARQALKERYRITSRSRPIEGEGAGLRFVVPTEQLPTPEQIMANEESMGNKLGMPVRIIALNPKEIEQMKLTWVVTVNAREKRSSELSKLMFRAEMQDARELGLNVNPTYAEERFAQVWEEDASKMFMQQEQATQQPTQPGMVIPGGQSEGVPTIKRPQMTVKTESPMPAPNLV